MVVRYILPKVTVSRRGIIVIVESLIVDIGYTDVMGKAKIIFHEPRTLVLVLSCTIKAARGEGGVDSVESRRDQHQQAAARLFWSSLFHWKSSILGNCKIMWSTTENLKLIFNFHCDEFLLTRLLLLEALSLRLEEMPENRKKWIQDSHISSSRVIQG